MNQAPRQPGEIARDLFLKALERSTTADRADFLDEACANQPSLRAEIV